MSTGYDPTEFSSDADYARSRAAADAVFAMPPSKPYPDTAAGRHINENHADREDGINREFGVPFREQTRKKWGIAGVADPMPPING
ncbi:MAG: hypothetical protein IT342_12320 [Candidatus Melainabacteria bacterium]|nr:hypothetical protein [Candidatus Melainabacteria bacterium]